LKLYFAFFVKSVQVKLRKAKSFLESRDFKMSFNAFPYQGSSYA
jgi:hypothetical protein